MASMAAASIKHSHQGSLRGKFPPLYKQGTMQVTSCLSMADCLFATTMTVSVMQNC